ncbi:PREDICTED: low molecular weight phosphotyrosine protein phosphatase-like [Vollenhovia emeryi]|uniref:low molecular weight phosphotyrosine protein phosphatase-like n=1 Tax=Vollenhovia emeryi TaxID=411798 RepID=UPI0005F56275|nr:PREDICTED: low molecular weight phosphotyrosine protein phosphatase-like [Vollenhovia emeryi]XP_011872537.1 PREDICTED: low molecular weight phosphotyrosine protein phosphatase-like [Vollenhovia emeryi]XP_011872538.1 PREDICTED: low molecular weight phosphotyrosine protein phosphatase-like [Vollenhovia emeryi]
MSEAKKKVLMVCLGNICRSPIAEAVFENEVNKRGLQDQWEVESAAVMGYHTGKKPDTRARSTLQANGITNYSHKARPIKPSDFNEYDWIFGMDHDNIEDLNKQKPENCRAKVELLGSYDPSGNIIIRDPYYDSNSAEFQTVYDQCLASVTAFLNKYTS